MPTANNIVVLPEEYSASFTHKRGLINVKLQKITNTQLFVSKEKKVVYTI